MAAFYKHSEGYAQQQGSHDAGYFTRLLGVMESVLTQPNLRLLEIGAGSAGAMREFLRRKPDARAIAMELSASSIASSRSSSSALRAVAGDALDLPFRNRSLDAVVAFEVMEHIPDVAHALEEALRVVRRPGTSSSVFRITHPCGRLSKIGFEAVSASRSASIAAGVRGRGGSGMPGWPGVSGSRQRRSSCIASRSCTRRPAGTPMPFTTRRRST